MENKILEAQDIRFSYGTKEILKGISMSFHLGEMYSIIGKSGSGKTTLLSVLSGISNVKKGQLRYGGQEIQKDKLGKYRRNISIIFQSYNLIHYMSAIQNVVTALDIVSKNGKHAKIANEVLEKVGIEAEDRNRPCTELSGGQQQRVAIARALACDTEIIFADEPTGNLDSETGKEIIELLKVVAHDEKKCVICVTHDNTLKKHTDMTYQIKDGIIKQV